MTTLALSSHIMWDKYSRMLNFHTFVHKAAESLDEAQKKGGGYWNEYYSDWGYIRPNGKVERMPKNAVVTDGHEELAERLGYDSIQDALEHGLARFLVIRGNGNASFQFRNEIQIRRAVAQYIEKSVIGEVDIEIMDYAVERTLVFKHYDDPKIAALQVRGGGVLREATIYSTNAREWGFIRPDGKVIQGNDKQRMHTVLARTLHFPNEQEAMIRGGLVRYCIDHDGDMNFEMLNRPPQRKATVQFIRDSSIDGHHVYVDFVAPDGNIAGYKDYDSPKAAERLLHLDKDEYTDLEEAEDQIPVTHRGAPIAAWSKEWGFIKPDGKIIQGDDPDGHLGLARKLGFQSETDAIKKGFVRYVIDPEGSASLELAPTEQTKHRVIRWLTSETDIKGSVYIDLLNSDGEIEQSEVYKGRSAAAQGIKALREPQAAIAEKMKTFSDFVMEAARRKREALRDDFFTVYHKPEEPLQPFPDQDDEKDGNPKPAPPVPDDVNPYAPVPVGGRRNDTRTDVPFIAAY